MDIEKIKQILTDAYLGLDKITIDESILFLQENVGSLSPNLYQYEILSAAAIVGQTRNISKISGLGYTKTGITFESIMKNIGKRSKEQFLDVITWVMGKWREAPMWIKVKIDNLKLSYRIYKKYRFMFEEMFNNYKTPKDQSKFNLMAIFWIAYLIIKHQNKQFDTTFETIPLLNSIILILFTEILNYGTIEQCNKIFLKHFNGSLEPQQQEYNLYKKLLIKKLSEIHQLRSDGQIKFDFNLIIQNQYYSLRFLSDISNKYDRLKDEVQDNFIDQASFLELTKDKSPYTVKRNITGTNKSITKKINLLQDSSQEESNEGASDNDGQNQDTARSIVKQQTLVCNNNYDFSPIKSKNNLATPVSSRYQNLGWINSILSKFNQLQIEQFKRIYERYCRASYKEYETRTLKKIEKSVIRFTDSKKRVESIYHFFIYFVNRVAEEHSEAEKMSIFGSNESIDSFLCLTTDIFNYAYHFSQTSYRENCQIFKVGLLEGHRPINWFGLYRKLPLNIQNYLYNLQKKILIRQIWQKNQGYDLISLDPEQKCKYNTQALLKRLNHHIDERTSELCSKMNIDSNEILKINNLVNYILQRKAILLKNHNIDQIIVCSIACILSVNQSKSNFSLTQIFAHYNSLIYSFYSIKNSLYDVSGNQIDLLEFYNQIFLEEIQEIINQEENIANILMTPIRLQRKRSRQMGVLMTPIHLKFKQTPMSFPRKMIKTQITGQSYRKSLANQLKSMEILQNNQNQEADELPSPEFRRISKDDEQPPVKMGRSFSFGNLDFS